MRSDALLLFMTGFLVVINNAKRYCGNWSRLMETKVFRLLSGAPDYDLNTALKIIAALLHKYRCYVRIKTLRHDYHSPLTPHSFAQNSNHSMTDGARSPSFHQNPPRHIIARSFDRNESFRLLPIGSTAG